MAQMGRYCKAYPVSRFQAFSGWSMKTENLRKEKSAEGRPETASPRQLGEQDYFFLQENFIVTDGVFLDQNIVFDQVTDEWKQFCADDLKFHVPERAQAKATI